jgi:hypothetical protein
LFGPAVTGGTDRLFVIVVVGIAEEDQSAAAGTGGIFLFKAEGAKRGVLIPVVIPPPDPIAAVAADRGFFLQTVGAEKFPVKKR